MRFGFHISIAGGLNQVVPRARHLGCETVQIFTSSQLRWRRMPLEPEEASRFRAELKEADIYPLVVHLFYLPNLATPDAKLLKRSRNALLVELERSAMLGAKYLVLHPGAYKESTLERGLKTVAASLDYVIAKAAEIKVGILIENTAGGGTRIGGELTELAGVFDHLKQTYPVGICLDIAHLYQAGYPVHTKTGLNQTLEEFDKLIGFEKLRLLHLNDSKTPLGSRNDRHWHIGKGEIGLQAFRRIINHPRLVDLPAIMETPSSSENDLMNITTVKDLRAGK